MTATITVSAYEPFLHREPQPPDVTLCISGSPPQMPNLDDARRWYQEQANDVFEALLHLPQGTLHELVIALLMHRADLYRGKPQT